MPDDYAIGTAAAERELNAEIKQFVPSWAQNQIPADLIHKAAVAIAKGVLDDVAKAHAK